MRRLAEETADDAPSRELAAAIAEVVDDEFRAHCRIAQVRGGTALVHVDQASLVSAMRMRWLAPLARAVRGGGYRSVSRFAFAYGRSGASVEAS